MNSAPKKVIIVGGGFAGLNAGKALANKKEVEVLLIDKKNHHLFQPLLYQVATAGLNPGDIAVPIRSQFSGANNIEVRLLELQSVDPVKNSIVAQNSSIKFDYLILACGVTHSYFGHTEWEEYAPGLKTLEQATEIRRRMLIAFEAAENEPDKQRRDEFLTFVVIGGGPTGVELAGAIADISRTVLLNEFRHIDPAQTRVVLLEAGPRILSTFSEKLSATAKADLQTLGVDVRTHTRVIAITQDEITTTYEKIRAKSVYWAAGVKAQDIAFTIPVNKDKSGRIITTADFTIPNHPNIFVVGDLAAYELSTNQTLPGLAPVAIQAGQYAAKAILDSIHGLPRKKFFYRDKGQLATIGKNKAIAQFNSLEMSGRPAWLIWLFVHILYLIGFKNKLFVLLQWAWSYIFSQRGTRLITSQDWRDP